MTERIRASIERFPRVAGVFAIAVGTTVLVGWILDIDLLKGAGHSITMKPNAAIGLIACGVSLIASTVAPSARRGVAWAMAVLAGTLGLLTLSQHLIGWDLHIDERLFHEAPGAPATVSPGRMGANASLNFCLAGIALIALTIPSPRAARWAQTLALVMTGMATIAVIGYMYSAQELYISKYTGIAWPTAITLLVVALGILVSRRDAGPIAAMMSPGPGGVMARRMLPAAVVVMLVLGYVRVLGQEAGLYDTGLGTALLVVTLIGVLAAMIWRTAINLDDTDRARESARRERDDLLVRERAAREQAERANRLKDEFLATVSHELRTPLNAIMGWTDMLRTNAIDPARRTEAADVVARNGRVLARLIDDLLDISRIVNGRLPLATQPVDLAGIANAEIEVVAPQARAKQVRLVPAFDGVSALVRGDPERLHQITGNLLQNAVKFTPAGGEVTVSIQVHPPTVDLVVSDTGKGIDPAFLPLLFQRFRQQDGTTTREHGGLGIGLSIVRELAELHGGSVEAFSAGPGRGSTFRVTLPLLQPEPASAATSA